jgi:hypothetical protein
LRNHKKMHCEREPSTSYFCHCGPWKTILTDCTHTDTDTHTHTHNSVSQNPAHGRVYSIQHYVIQFVSDLWQVGGFLYTTLCDTVCQWLAAGRWFSLYNIMWYSLSVTCGRSVVFSIQHNVIQFVSDLRQVGGFLSVLQCSPPIQLKYHWKWR